ncbi:unnamed protein product, partial [Arabidopsis halleri]
PDSFTCKNFLRTKRITVYYTHNFGKSFTAKRSIVLDDQPGMQDVP